MPSPKRVTARYLQALSPDFRERLRGVVSQKVMETIGVMGSVYKRIHNAQKVGGKTFENFLEDLIPHYDPRVGGFGDWVDPSWVPHIGPVEFEREDLEEVKKLVRDLLLQVLEEHYGESLGMSSAFRWDTETEEVFSFLLHSWDVRQAKRIIVARPRVVVAFSLEGLAGVASRVLGMNPSQDSVDFRLPIVVVTTPQGNYLPIDGWNRIRKALLQGLTEVPSVLLNASESRKVTLSG